jgi:hypothetical protein
MRQIDGEIPVVPYLPHIFAVTVKIELKLNSKNNFDINQIWARRSWILKMRQIGAQRVRKLNRTYRTRYLPSTGTYLPVPFFTVGLHIFC